MQMPITPVKTTPKLEKKPKEPKPVKLPREPKPPKEKKEKQRKVRKLDSDSAAAAGTAHISSSGDPQSDPSAFYPSADIFQNLPMLQSLLQYATTNPASAQAIIQGNPAIMGMLAHPGLMNLLLMSSSYVNSFMSASTMPSYGGFPDMSQFGLSGGMGVASPFYVPPVDPSILTQFMMSPDFSSFNSSAVPGLGNPPTPNAASGQDPAVLTLKQEHNQNESHMS